MKTTPDWYGECSHYRPQYELTLKDGVLRYRYSADKAPSCREELKQGQFVEGLWEHDVAEFFVASSEGTDYQEINISPTGAWWSAYFSDYRQLEREVRFEPRLQIVRNETAWQIVFETELDNLVPWENAKCRLFSAASILYDPAPHYFCWNHKPGADEPDFHRRDLFMPLS